jgi:CDP-glucose 4,6-dehydratase
MGAECGPLEGLEVKPHPEWQRRRVLVTGHTGFKGAWLTLWLERLGAEVHGLSLPPPEGGAFRLMQPCGDPKGGIGDLRDEQTVIEAVSACAPEVIFHLGAQALVRQGYANPLETYATNVMGTLHVLQAAARVPGVRAIVVVTSDKVYANDGDGRPFCEEDRLGHPDPYSTSKACAELVTAAWSHVKQRDGVHAATARAGNVIGGGDVAKDRLIPDIIRSNEAGTPLPLRYPASTRPWQHVLEPLHGYLLLAERLLADPAGAPRAVNFGPAPDSVRSVAEVVDRVFGLLHSGSWVLAKGPEPPETPTLQLDSSLARSALNWRPRLDLDSALQWTVAWYEAARRGDDMRRFSVRQIVHYETLLAGP